MVSADCVTVIGSGYVGLTTGACLASLGHTVTCVDHDPSTVEALRNGRTYLAEPDMSTLLLAGLNSGTLTFDTAVETAVAASDIIFLCLPTPPGPDGAADLTAIEQTVTKIRDLLHPDAVLVTKSTVPVGTTAKIHALLRRSDVGVVSNPEFLREGHAVTSGSLLRSWHTRRSEPGRTATEMSKRVAFQQMLTRVRNLRDVDYIIVYKLSRMARNRLDDASSWLISANAASPSYRLPNPSTTRPSASSCTASWPPSTSTSRGSPAPTLDELSDELYDRGLRTRPTARHPAKQVSINKLSMMLRDRYYLGYVTYKGDEVQGRHEPLIDDDLFDRVQDLLESRATAKERRRAHHHYLKGSLFCGRCERASRSG